MAEDKPAYKIIYDPDSTTDEALCKAVAEGYVLTHFTEDTVAYTAVICRKEHDPASRIAVSLERIADTLSQVLNQLKETAD